MSYEDNFSLENILDYGRACKDVATYLSTLSHEYGNLLIPSRGVLPICAGAEALTVDDILNYDNFFYDLVVLPFTSDNFRQENRDAHVRDFWVGVYADMLHERETPSTQFYNHMKDISKQDGQMAKLQRFLHITSSSSMIAEQTELYSRVDKKTVYIDTVISGRASSQILKSMETRDLDVFAILLVDENGEKLKPEYKRHLESYVHNGKGAIIPVNKLFTEDNGPGLLGATSVVFPGIIEQAGNIEELNRNGFNFPGAGIVEYIPMGHPILPEKLSEESIFTMNPNPLFKASFISNEMIKASTRQNAWEEKLDKKFGTDHLEMRREQLLDLIKQEGVLDKELTKEKYQLFGNRIKEDVDINTTSSHVVEVRFDDKTTEKYIQDFKQKLR